MLSNNLIQTSLLKFPLSEQHLNIKTQLDAKNSDTNIAGFSLACFNKVSFLRFKHTLKKTVWGLCKNHIIMPWNIYLA